MASEYDNPGASLLALQLPFYVNGTLSAEERRRIEDALATDTELQAELDSVREIAELVRSGGTGLAPAAGAASPERLKALLARVEAETPHPAQATRDSRLRHGGQRAPAPAPWRYWKPALAAAALLVVVQAGFIAYQWTPREGYTTLSGPDEATRTPSGRLLMRLTPDARWGDVEALLSSRDLTIVGGPRDRTLDVAIGADEPLDEVTVHLRASPLVEFVGVQP
jgi:anti-sigma factor RsiW